MSRDHDDDEALTWAGGRDPSHYETPVAKVTTPAKPMKPGKSATPAPVSEAEPEPEPDERIATSALMLVCLGILGGIDALYTLGWYVSWQRLLYADPDYLEFTAFHIQQVLAILAPPLWFGAAIYFTRGRRPAIRLLWLVIGALALVPWSFTFGQ